MGGMEVWGPRVFSVSPCGEHAGDSLGFREEELTSLPPRDPPRGSLREQRKVL